MRSQHASDVGALVITTQINLKINTFDYLKKKKITNWKKPRV